ncbi:MAG: CoA pyrophosphatase, partial [Sinobacterium sp.]|nr:CoA pyrophosphatase [Sinobacterium sp.]
MLDAKRKLQADLYTPQKKWYRHLAQRAGVSIILSEENQQLSFLMMQRAHHEGDPWSGQMAFPGGKQDNSDGNITETALRESLEEMGIHSTDIQRISRLSDILARPYRPLKKPMVVSPIIFQQVNAFTPVINDEVADWLWLPVSFFQDKSNRKTMTVDKSGFEHELPCYDFKGKRVWG